MVTSGGSESLITALYTYREAARQRGVTKPNVVMPVTAHVALDKGAYWMDIEVRHAPLTESFTADVAAMAQLMDDQTIALVGSAGDYAHGLIDPIEEIAALAADRGSACTSTAAWAGCCGRGPRNSATPSPMGFPGTRGDVDLG